MRLRTHGGWDDQESRRIRGQGSRKLGRQRNQDRRKTSGKVQEPGRTGKVGRGVVEIRFWGIDLTACGRLASNQLVHACAGDPIPFSKVPGKCSQAGNVIKQATLEQGDLEDWLSTDMGACVGAIDPEPGLRRPPCVGKILSKTHPSKTLPKRKTGRWRRAVPESWKVPVISTEPEHSYDLMNDIHFSTRRTSRDQQEGGRQRSRRLLCGTRRALRQSLCTISG